MVTIHQSSPGSTPDTRPDAIHDFSLLVVSSAPKGFPRLLWFSPLSESQNCTVFVRIKFVSQSARLIEQLYLAKSDEAYSKCDYY